jgi:iron(III) transport system permease protein
VPAGGSAPPFLPPGTGTRAGRVPFLPQGGRALAWFLLATLTLAVLAPLALVLFSLTLPPDEQWLELSRIVLPRYLTTSLQLALGVGLATLLLGVSTAWLVTRCHTPGWPLLQWLLVLPLAFPTYLLAYAYTDLLEYAGPVQTTLRAWFGWSRRDYLFPEIRSVPGAIMVLTLALYPYVYLLARTAFLRTPASLLEAGRILGGNPWRNFLTIALPLARPALVAGLALAMMETLADFGAVQYFAIDTFTTGIYLSWFALGSPQAAAQLAALLLLTVGAVLLAERLARGSARYHEPTARSGPPSRYRLGPLVAIGAVVLCLLPVLFGFVVPVAVFLRLAAIAGDARFGPDYLPLVRNSVLLAGAAALLITLLALALGYAVRLARQRALVLLARLAGLGYAIPGSVLSIGVLAVLGAVDRLLNASAERLAGGMVGLVAGGSLAALLYAYSVRFLAVGQQAVESGFARLGPTLDDAARTLGEGPFGVLRRVHLPLLRASLLTGLLLAFVDVLKELPATLIVRPFNLDTLAVRAYQLATDERLAEAATPALTIVAAGLLPVLALSVAIARSGESPR